VTEMRAEPVADLITLGIVQSSLQAISDEMFAAYRKAAMSTIIYEVLDLGTGITDGEGNIAASGAGCPGFVGVLDKAVKRIIEIHGSDGFRPGDIFVTNDPFYGGVTHLNDLVLAMPIFADDELIAWSANIAHSNDVGGIVPGSLSNEATEIFQEGLRLPAVKLVSEGDAIQSVVEIIRVNSRLPDFIEGDLWAGVASARVGARRIGELIDKYGPATFTAALRRFMEDGEKAALRALGGLPNGVFRLDEEQDNGSHYKVTIEIEDDAFVVDLRDNPDQDPFSSNLSRDATLTAVQVAYMNITGAHASANGGHFKPLRVLTRPGSIFDPLPPAAFAWYAEAMIRVYDLILRCLAPHLGDLLPAGNFASICGTVIGGPHPDTGRPVLIVEPQIGGWGASASRDGNSAIFTGVHGETFNCPAEVAEARYGVSVEQLRLNDEAGGEGKHRGGKGIVLDYRVRADGYFLSCAYTRNKQGPWALDGGREGSTNRIEVIRVDGTVEEYAYVTNLTLNEGDIVRVHTAQGGGHGAPRERSRDLVLDDLRNEYVSAETARDIYGIDTSTAGGHGT
jgi:N-methylhydantoinase B